MMFAEPSRDLQPACRRDAGQFSRQLGCRAGHQPADSFTPKLAGRVNDLRAAPVDLRCKSIECFACSSTEIMPAPKAEIDKSERFRNVVSTFGEKTGLLGGVGLNSRSCPLERSL